MMEINQGEIAEAIEALGDGKHSMNAIENQIIVNRHNKLKQKKKKGKKCSKSTIE